MSGYFQFEALVGKQEISYFVNLKPVANNITVKVSLKVSEKSQFNQETDTKIKTLFYNDLQCNYINFIVYRLSGL